MLSNSLGRFGRAVGLASTVLVAWLFIGAGSAHAQEGAVAGTVADSETLQPVAGAQVFIPGTEIGALTGQNGTFRLTGVPVGEVTVEVRLIGYRQATQTVTVRAGEVSTADFELEQTALRLQDIVVTGVIGETPRVKLPFTVESLDTDDMPVPTSNVSGLLHGKSPGVSIVQGSGQPGTGASITLRGATSIDASGRSQAPLIVIDGVIQSDGASLADINSLDVQNIQIVKGAAAASLYGSRAANGVIEVTTKRGESLAPNTFNVTLRNEFGFSSLEGEVPLARNHHFVMNESQTAWISSTGQEVTEYKNLGRPGFGNPVLKDGGTPATAFQDGPFPNPLIDHIDTFFDPGETYSNYAAASGRFGESSFRASFENFRETGVIECSTCGIEVKDEGFKRRNARVNVDSRAASMLDIAVSGFYSQSEQDDAAVANGSFFSLTFMSPAIDLTEPDEDGFPRIDADPLSQEENPLYQLAIADFVDERQRVMGSIDGTLTLTDWFSVEGNASYDRTDFDRQRMEPKSAKSSAGGITTTTGGFLNRFNFFETAVNASITASFNRAFLDGDLTTRLKARYLVEDQEFESTGTSGNSFIVEGVPTFAALDRESLSAGNRFEEIKAQGYFGIAGLDYKGKYIVDGLVRRDGSSLFGPAERWQTYYRGSAAYRITQEDWWNIGAIDELKFRYSIGTAGGRPNFSAQFETFGVSAGRVFPINLGNQALKPEFSVEQEAGLDLVLYDRIGLGLTYAWSTVEDQLLRVPQPGFVGFSSRWENAGEIETQTIEGSLRASIIDRSDMGLSVRLNVDHTEQEITALTVPDFTQSRFFVYPGAEMGELWGERFATSCADLSDMGIEGCSSQFQVNDDGYLVFVGDGNSFQDGISQGLWGTTGSVSGSSFDFGMPIVVEAKSPACLAKKAASECPNADFLPIGNTTPDFNASFATNFRWQGLTLNTLLDSSVGHDIYNQTRQWAYREKRSGDVDQAGKPEGLKKPVQYYSTLYSTNSTTSHFVEEGDWLKLRELSVGYTFPQTFVQDAFKGHIDRLTLNVIGRNLLTITDYTGYDPEVGFAGGSVGSAAINRQDSFTYPNFRTFTASLEIVF